MAYGLPAMSLTLYMHPLSSYCNKVLIALYDAAIPFTPESVNLGDAGERAALCALWPPGRFPVLRDAVADRVVAESSIIIEYLAQHHASARGLVPVEPEAALHVRAADRMFDLDIHVPMQRIVGDRLRPANARDPHGVAAARAQIRTGYAMVERLLAHGPWACGEAFTLADCAAAPALAFADRVEPLGDVFPRTTAYLARLRARPSYARVVEEAAPFLAMFPHET